MHPQFEVSFGRVLGIGKKCFVIRAFIRFEHVGRVGVLFGESNRFLRHRRTGRTAEPSARTGRRRQGTRRDRAPCSWRESRRRIPETLPTQKLVLFHAVIEIPDPCIVTHGFPARHQRPSALSSRPDPGRRVRTPAIFARRLCRRLWDWPPVERGDLRPGAGWQTRARRSRASPRQISFPTWMATGLKLFPVKNIQEK